VERIVFVSLFLGLVSGTQWVEMRADPEVRSIRITLDGREVASLRRPPWQTAVDLGGGLAPGELVATGFNDHNEPIARASQVLNLPRPVAELELVVHREQNMPALVSLVWRHREHEQPRRATISVDGSPLRVTREFTARLPSFKGEHPHVIAAEMRFTDSTVARCDHVIQGGFSDEVGTQLTPIALHRVPSSTPTEALDGCLTVNGKAVRATAADNSDALLIVVKDPDPAEARSIFRGPTSRLKKELPLDADTSIFFVWPIASKIKEPGEPETRLFVQSGKRKATDNGMPWLLTLGLPRRSFDGPRLVADAVAVAGVRAVRSARRRAVILLLSAELDESHYQPAAVRRYLASIGVPLFVWSLSGPRPDLANSWGAVDDISTRDQLSAAVAKVRRSLDEQRIAWVASDPLSALRVQASERCGVTPLAERRAE